MTRELRDPEMHPAWRDRHPCGIAGISPGISPPWLPCRGALLLMQAITRQKRSTRRDWSLLMLFLDCSSSLEAPNRPGSRSSCWASRNAEPAEHLIFAAVVTLLSNVVSNVPP